MKNNQKGFIGMGIAIILALILGATGAYYYQQNKVNVEEASEVMNNAENYSDQNNTSAQIEVKKESPLSENDILKATYKISASFNGTKTAPQNVVFPEIIHRVYISEKGELQINSQNPTGEVFVISRYKFTNQEKTEALVYIVGNYGASGYDDRAFIVKKVNGTITTQETTCTKNLNGSCKIDSNLILNFQENPQSL